MNPFTALKKLSPFHFTSLFPLIISIPHFTSLKFTFFHLFYQPFTSLHFFPLILLTLHFTSLFSTYSINPSLHFTFSTYPINPSLHFTSLHFAIHIYNSLHTDTNRHWYLLQIIFFFYNLNMHCVFTGHEITQGIGGTAPLFLDLGTAVSPGCPVNMRLCPPQRRLGFGGGGRKNVCFAPVRN